MSTLHERLADLATDAPASHPDPLLWDRAARFHRRRRAGTAGLVAVAVLAVLSLVGIDAWQRSPGIEPAAPGVQPALPARFWEPSPWLPGTGGDPTGPLAALITAERKGWFSSKAGVVGVSATTGEYRFLDLPDDAGRDPALSPDGSKVAYWTTGPTRLSPNTSGGQERPATGVAVFDTGSGSVSRHPITTDHGVTTDEGLWWADSETLVFSYGQIRGGEGDPVMDQSSASFPEALLTWRMAEAAPRVSDLAPRSIDATNGRGLLLADGRVLDVIAGTQRRLDYRSPSLLYVSALDPSGTAVAAPRGNRNPNELFVTREGEAEQVVDDEVWQAVAWVDEDTVAYVTRDTDKDPIPAYVETVSLSTGERSTLVEMGTFQPVPGSVATDLLAVDPRDFPEPSTPWNPRVVAGLVGFGTLVAVLWLRGWRRRVEA